MEGALGWISSIIEWIGQFVPRWVILNTTHAGVKFIRGSRVVKLGPGIHWYWPATTNLHTYPVARQTTNLRAQTLVTSDDRTIIVSGLIVYRVDDVVALIARNYDADDTIEEIALSAVNAVCSSMSWEDLKKAYQTRALDRELRKRTRHALETYGVHVMKATLTDLAPCRVIRLVGDRPLIAGS
jgi:regulator of protease activity HflC (stomatin/prohibitin superfamily)